MKKNSFKKIGLLISILVFTPTLFFSQSNLGKIEKWLNVGSFHHWYSSIGGEREEDHPAAPTFIQLWGYQWPAIYPRQDMMAASGLWIGAKNYLDPATNTTFDFKVVHCGPRPQTGGSSEFFPIEFKHYAKFQPTEVRVDGALTHIPGQEVNIDEIFPDMPYDQMIYNYVNTQMGMSMKRRIFQFSNSYYDNFHVIEYTFINTGNIDDDEEIERNSGTLEDVYFYFQKRLGFIQETRLIFGTPTQYGANTLNNEFGPYSAGHNDDMRYSYGWFGYWKEFSDYNNIGGPLWYTDAGQFDPRINPADTVGRLAIPQFTGSLTLYAQTSVQDNSNDSNQPSTTGYESSDGDLMYSSDVFNASQMQRRYELMIKGHPEKSHADLITGGDYVNSKAFPGENSANSAGYSYVNGYGPYQIPFGDSIKIVLAVGSSGLSRDECIRIGKLFKDGTINVSEKNTEVLSGADSLRQTFLRASDAYNNNWNIPESPHPPSSFFVTSRGGRIDLEWTLDGGGPVVTGFEIYRNTVDPVDGYASNEYFSKYEKIAELGPNELSYSDSTQRQDIAYYYYIVTLGEDIPTNNDLNIPAHKLRSSRYYTQTYIGAFRRRPGEANITNKVRVYPNPYIISASDNWMFGSNSAERNKIAFDNLSGECKIIIFTEIGERIRTIEHTDGSGSEDWDLRTSSNQLVASGIYIAVIIDSNTGDKEIEKFSIIR